MTPPTVEGAARSAASGPVRVAWALFGAFLLFWLVLEMVNHGGGTVPLGIAGLFAPDLTLFVGPSGSHGAGQLPRGRVPGYNLVHRPVVPLLWLAVCVVLPDPPGTALFTFGLAWLLHIAVDRALGYRPRTAGGRQR